MEKLTQMQETLDLLRQGWNEHIEYSKENNRNNLQVINFKDIKNDNSNTTSLSIEGEEMKGITLRKDGRYTIRKCINGKRLTLYAKTMNEAKKIYTKLKRNQIKTKEKKQKLTFENWTENWINLYKKPFLKESSLLDILGVVKVLNKKFGNKTLDEIKPLEIQEYINSFEKSRKRERIQTYLNAILQKAEDLNMINKNPFKAVTRNKKGKWKRDCFNFEEQTKIINAIKNTDIEHEIFIYLMTGCRPNELPPKENFNFENNTIIINGTKNENAKCRIIEMSNNFAIYIKDYFNKNERKSFLYIREEFKKICTSLKIEQPLLYRLRHTFATNHFTLGTNAKYVQTWLGHYSISMTLDQYTDIDKTATKEKIRKLYNNFYFEPK